MPNSLSIGSLFFYFSIYESDYFLTALPINCCQSSIFANWIGKKWYFWAVFIYICLLQWDCALFPKLKGHIHLFSCMDILLVFRFINEIVYNIACVMNVYSIYNYNSLSFLVFGCTFPFFHYWTLAEPYPFC